MSRSLLNLLIGSFAIILIAFSTVECGWVPCMDGVTRVLDVPTSRTSVTNFTISIVPRAPSGDLHPTSYVSVTMRGFQELLRPGIQCYERASTFPITGDEGALVQPYPAILIEDLLCDYQVPMIWYYEGVELQTLEIKAKHPQHPLYSLSVNITISTEEKLIPEHYSVTQNQTYFARYQKNFPKITFAIDNWPWNSTDTDSYLLAYWNFDFFLPGTFSVNTTRIANTTYLGLKSDDGQLEYRYEVDQTFVLDDLILVRQMEDIPINMSGVTMEDSFIGLMKQTGLSLSFCERKAPGYHYDRVYHDPSIIALFSPSPSNSPTKNSSKGLSGPQIAGIVIAVIVVCAIAAFIITLWAKPELKNIFRPFRKISKAKQAVH